MTCRLLLYRVWGNGSPATDVRFGAFPLDVEIMTDEASMRASRGAVLFDPDTFFGMWRKP